jgi:hypothetical protein
VEERSEKYNKLLNKYADEISEHMTGFLINQRMDAFIRGEEEAEAQFESVVCYFSGMMTASLRLRSKEYRLKVLENISRRLLGEDA